MSYQLLIGGESAASGGAYETHDGGFHVWMSVKPNLPPITVFRVARRFLETLGKKPVVATCRESAKAARFLELLGFAYDERIEDYGGSPAWVYRRPCG